MSFRVALSTVLVSTLACACTSISGLDGYGVAGDPARARSGKGDVASSVLEATAADAGEAAAVIGDVKYRRAIDLVSDAPSALDAHATLVVLPPSFDYAHAKSDGADLRFSTDSKHTTELPYYIESWSSSGASFVWVLVPSVPTGASKIYAFYGSATLGTASDFTKVFPHAQTSTGNITLDADIDTDWFELKSEHTLTLGTGKLHTIRAQRIIIAGAIDGNGRGHPSPPLNTDGIGPGGGHPSPGNGSGGAGYGGAGGRGGADATLNGLPGNAYGTDAGDDIDIGSSGGAADEEVGSAGGGGISLVGWRTTISNAITMNGNTPVGLNGQNPGGGAGGGILVAGFALDLASAVLSANGGGGGPCLDDVNDGGGGGGGGRIKIFGRPNGTLEGPATMTVLGGAGGAGGNTTAPGAAGLAGTAHVTHDAKLAKGVEVTLEAEEALR